MTEKLRAFPTYRGLLEEKIKELEHDQEVYLRRITLLVLLAGGEVTLDDVAYEMKFEDYETVVSRHPATGHLRFITKLAGKNTPK